MRAILSSLAAGALWISAATADEAERCGELPPAVAKTRTAILDAAAAQGVTSAGMVLLRLPGEVRDVFREWLLRHYPDRVKHVLGLVREARNGRDNDPNFHTRFKGEGAYAVLLQQRFEKAVERYGLNKPRPALRTDLFQRPAVEDNQLALF